MKTLVPFMMLLFASESFAAQVDGSTELGIWYVKNDLTNNPLVQVNDGFGANYISDQYALGLLGLKLTATDLTDGTTPYTLNSHVRGKVFYKLTDSDYTLGFEQRTRQEIGELNIEAKGVGAVDLWVGRQTVYEAGGAMFDGLRVIYPVKSDLDVSLYGGLGADPRQLTGYIGPAYENVPFTLDFQSVGTYVSLHRELLKIDGAFRSELFKRKIDRMSLFSQASYQANSMWSFSGLLEYDVAGEPGLRTGGAYINTRPTPTVTNTLSFMRWSALLYKESNLSAIPINPDVAAASGTAPVGGTEVNRSSYNSLRDQIMFRLFQRDYIFGAIQFSRRTFDHLNQFKYTVGYRNPTLFDSPFDIRVQTDLIDNYRGFNTAFDAIMGKNFSEGQYRLEWGGTYFANERDVYLNLGPDPNQPRQTEKEYALRLNFFYNPTRTFNWFVNYAFYADTDAVNDSQKVHSHEIYASSIIRF